MSAIKILPVLIATTQLVAATLLIGGCTTAPPPQEQTAPAGLQALTGTSLDSVYIAPEADFDRYQSVYIEPVEIHYDSSPRQDVLQRGPDAFRLDDRQQKILQERYQRAVAEVLEDRRGWKAVGKPGPGVLALRSELHDFYLYASLQNDEPQPARTLVGESSRFTLAVQLVDAGTGALLLQSRDRRVTGNRGSSPGNLRPFSAVRYWSDFHQDIHRWARQLHNALQQAEQD